MYEALKQVFKPHSVICFLNLFQIWQTLGLSFDHMIIYVLPKTSWKTSGSAVG